ncbi:MAG: hypothetical protein M3Y12_06530, partial [Bacteroidota bacterium]|nr:hypothetical protein [Bacteroidota bacterium]
PDESFFEDNANILPFPSQQHQGLHKRLLIYGYEEVSRQPNHIEYMLARGNAPPILALLFDGMLSFAISPSSSEDIFDIGMTASEFTDDGDFAKYDSQLGEWERIED